MPELFDLYDNERKPLGKVFQRGLAIPTGLYHVVVSVWTINERSQILLTLRSPQKHLMPNLWESTSGSVQAGEDSLNAALRELREETGIVASLEEITFLGTTRKEASFVDIFIVRKKVDLSEIILQEDETVAAKWVTFSQLQAMESRGELAFPISYQFPPFQALFSGK
ncbi:MAG: NUDIX domain-containing protein [Spirochaetia bacterium]|nr:NUDIX domain-containing protein [Spirochaetia bacterium]